MVRYRQKNHMIWFAILIEGLCFYAEVFGQNQEHSFQTLVGQSLVTTNSERSARKIKNIEHGQEVGDMAAMVDELNGKYSFAGLNEDNLWDDGDTARRAKRDWHVKLDQLNRYQLDWTVDYPGNEIIFTLSINHTTSKFIEGSDVFALGFSENGNLTSSDFCIIWYDLSHKLHLQDARTDAKNRLQLTDSARSHCQLLRLPLSAQSDVTNGGGDADYSAIEDSVHGNDEEYHKLEKRDTSHHAEGGKGLRQDIEISFKRPLDVCHPEGNLTYYRIDNGTTHLVWFTIKGPLLSIDGLDLTELAVEKKYHPHQNEHLDGGPAAAGGQFESGMRRVQLIATKAREPKAGSMSLDIRMEKFPIPARETTYWCKLFKLPHKFETRRYHLTKYEAVIEKGNEHVVHHMELFNCANLNAKQEQALHDLYEGSGWSGDCGGPERPKATQPCRKVILAWAMGAHPLVYPEQVGQSIGGQGYSPFVVLEVHYNNVESSAGLIDNSGLRFHYTSRLRPYDAGILEVGLEYTDKMSIPPRFITPIAGHCVSECTRVSMSSSAPDKSLDAGGGRTKRDRQEVLEDGIYVFAGQMHTHLAGVASWTEIVREGRLVGELQRDNHYSPHFQEIRLLPEPVHLAPGDALIHYCLYDTRQRANITLGGYATSDEMCVTYLHYYPRVDLEVCKSSVDTRALEDYFAYLTGEEDQSTSERLVEAAHSGDMPARAKSVSENYRSIEWNPRRSKELIQFYANAPLSVQCNRSNGDRWPGHWNGMAPTKLWSDSATKEPFESKPPRGEQLVAYRGQGFGARHAQCLAYGAQRAHHLQ